MGIPHCRRPRTHNPRIRIPPPQCSHQTAVQHPRSTFIALAGYAGATLILSYRIASHSDKDAIAVFVGCRRTAEELESINGYTPVNPKGAISAINKILYCNDNTAFIMLLVDIIRIANHVTRN